MGLSTSISRQRILVEGADATLTSLDVHRQTTSAGVAAALALAGSRVDWGSIRDRVIAAERSIVLAERDDASLLAARAFGSDSSTTIHDHGCAGAALVVHGRSRYQRFERTGASTVRLESVHDLLPGDVVWWNEPPDDVHRQIGIAGVSIEIVLLAGEPIDPATVFEDVSPQPSAFRAAVTAAFLGGQIGPLVPWYDPDVLGDLVIPQRRLQVRGRDDLLGLLDREDFTKPDRRLSALRVTDTAEGLLVETETRFADPSTGALRWFREIHNLRCRGGVVAEHAVSCSGISGADPLRSSPLDRL